MALAQDSGTFYMESGSIEYDTPGGKLLLPAGSGGIVNSNVLHMTKAISQKEKNIQLLHIFDVSYLSGEQVKQDCTKIYCAYHNSPTD